MANYAEALSAKESVRRAAKSKKVLRAIDHERTSNGGHVFTHRFHNNDGPGYHEAETYSFGKDEGDKALAHFAKHAGIKGASEEQDEPEHK